MNRINNELQKLKKVVAVVISAAFLSGIIYPLDLKAAIINDKNNANTAFSVPVSAGKITLAKYYGSKNIVINIQDIHCHSEVQRNISKLIGDLDTRYSLKNIFLEGASGELDTTLLTSMMENDFGKDAIEIMVDSGYMGGAEYYSALEGKKGFVKGIENEKIYTENIELLNEIMETEAEVEKMCDELVKELRPVKREYSNKDVSKLNRISKKFEKGSMNAAEYYSHLFEMAQENGIDTSKYKNIKGYAEFSSVARDINREQTSKQFNAFFNILKQRISYKELSELSDKSANFTNIEEISTELSELEKEYGIIEENRFQNLKNFLAYVEFSKNANPMYFVDEEKTLKEELYGKLGRSQYEQEVIFLSEFIPAIKGYFTASITPEELQNFESDFKRFKYIWSSYFPENRVRHLDKYSQLLKHYHNNNLKRDKIFSEFIAGKNNSSSNVEIAGKEALNRINAEADGNNLKIVVTGGFHSSGLEKIFNDNKITYVVITPKVTKDAGEAYEIYKNTIKGYKNFQQNAINIKPFLKEKINESLPKLMFVSFMELAKTKYSDRSDEEKQEGVYGFVQDFISKHDIGDIAVESLNIERYTKKGMEFSVIYKNKISGEIAGEKKYEIKDGKLIEKLKEEKIEAASSVQSQSLGELIKRVWRDIRSKGYEITMALFVPVLEEFVFRFLPFAITGLFITNPLTAIPLAISAIAGVGIFTFAHIVADNTAIKAGKIVQRRDAGRIFLSSVILTAVFTAVAALVPGGALSALLVTSVIHSINNILSLSGKIKNPILSIVQKIQNENIKTIIADPLENVLRKASDYKTASYKDLNSYGRIDFDLYEGTLMDLQKSVSGAGIVGSAVMLYKLLEELEESSYLDNNSLYKIIALIALKNLDNKEIIAILPELKLRVEGYMDPSTQRDEILKLISNHLNSLKKSTDDKNYKDLKDTHLEILVDAETAAFYKNTVVRLVDPENRLQLQSVEEYSQTLKMLRKGLYLYPSSSPEHAVVVSAVKILLNEMFAKANNTSVDRKSRELFAELIGVQASDTVFYNISEIKEILDLNKINDLFKKLKLQGRMLRSDLYIKSFGTENDTERKHLRRLNFTTLIGALSEDILPQENLSDKAPVFFKVTGETKVNLDMSSKIRKLSEANVRAMNCFRNISLSSSETEIKMLLGLLEEMAVILKEINEKDGAAAMEALKTMQSGVISLQELLKSKIEPWDPANLDLIRSVHTLINAIHQTSITDARISIRSFNRQDVRLLETFHNNKSVEISDLSVLETINYEAANLIEKVVFEGVDSSGFILDGDLLIWSQTFGAHSADVFFNFNKNHREISISFNESADAIGNKNRLYYFKQVLIGLGFDVNIDFGSSQQMPYLQAKYSKDTGMNKKYSFVEIAFKVVSLLGTSKDLDYSLENRLNAEELDPLVDKFNAGEIRYGYKSNDAGFFELWARVPYPKLSQAQDVLNKILNNLQLPGIPSHLSGIKLTQALADEYFNNPIKEAFIRGKILINAKGQLVANDSRNIMKNIIDSILKNKKELSAQSQLINFIDYDELNLRSEYIAGSMIGVNGYFEAPSGYVSLSGVMDKTTRRIEFAYTEFVDFAGTRRPLSSKELLELINKSGFYAKKQNAKSKKEISMTVDKLHQKIENKKECIEIFGIGLSSTDGKVARGIASYDIKESNENSILITPYITPDDMENIKGPGVIVTSGGANSHSSVVAYEKGKSIVLERGSWKGGRINSEHYTESGDKEIYRDFEIRLLEAKNIEIQEGEMLLTDGDTGEIYVFRSSNSESGNIVFRQLFDAINEFDINRIRDLIVQNKDSQDIGKILEYVFYSVVGKSEYKEILNMILGVEVNDTISAKIEQLKDDYATKLHEDIGRKFDEIDKITNVVSIKLTQIIRLEEDIRTLKSITNVNDKRRNVVSIFDKEKSKVLRSFKKDVRKYIKNAQYLIQKGNLNTSELEEAVRLVKMAKYWNNFYDYNGIEQIVKELDLKISKEKARRKELLKSDVISGFDTIYTFDEDRFGSKTVELAKYYKTINKMGLENVRVPHGYGVSNDAVELFFEVSGKQDEFRTLYQSLSEKIREKSPNEFNDVQRKEDIKNIAKRLTSLFENSDNEKFKKMIEESIKSEDNNTKYAVRSSGIGEDSLVNTFAGMGESELNVPADQVYESVKRVWISFFSERSMDYILQMPNPEMVKPAVLIQAMASDNVEKAGAMITRNQHAYLTIEAVYGLSADMMTGKMTPDRAIVNTTGATSYVRADKNKVKLVSVPEGGTTLADLTIEEQTSRVMDSKLLDSLRKIAYEIEKAEGYPVESEFAQEADSGIINVLQVRATKVYVVNGYEIGGSYNIAFISEDADSNPNPLLYVSNPENPEQAISVFIKKIDGNNIVLSVDKKYRHLIGAEGTLVSNISERINLDPVVLKKFNNRLPITAKAASGEIEVIPFVDEIKIEKIYIGEQESITSPISKMMSAA